jgi:hypothetical protein
MQIMMIWRRIYLRKSNHITFYVQQLFFFFDRAVSDNVVKRGTAGQATDDNIAKAQKRCDLHAG